MIDEEITVMSCVVPAPHLITAISTSINATAKALGGYPKVKE
jgi:hypothetical protein